MLIKKTELLLIIFVFIFCRTSLGSEEIIAGADEWCPHTCAAGQKYDGFSSDLLREALKLSNLELKYQNASFNRVTFQVEEGQWQIHVATNKIFTPNLLIGNEVVSKSKWVYVSTQKSGWTYKGIESLKGKRFAKISGYVYSRNLTEFYDKPENKNLLKMISSDSPQHQILKLMLVGRIDIMIEDESVIRYWAKKMGLENKIVLSGVDSTQNFYPAYSIKKDPAHAKNLMNLVDRNLKIVKKDTKLMDALFKKYGILKWE